MSGIYLHFPYCQHLCNYCDFYKQLSPDTYQHYERWLEQSLSSWEDDLFQLESKYQLKLQDPTSIINLKNFYSQFQPQESTLFLGGGTPSLWGRTQGMNFLKKWFEKFTSHPLNWKEATLEVNPGAWTREQLLQWKDIVGINRTSIGIQTLQENMLPWLDRKTNVRDLYELLEVSQGTNYSVDFMIGLPYSEALGRDILKELETILQYQPRHISVYILSTKSHYPHKAHLPSDEIIAKEYEITSNYLTKMGFIHYEVSNFALPGYESQHNLKYWNLEPMLAFGPSAVGCFANLSQKNLAVRWKWLAFSTDNPKPRLDWEFLTPEEYMLEKRYLQLRLKTGFSIEDSSVFIKDPSQFLQEQANLGYFSLQQLKNNKIQMTPKGWLIMDHLFLELDKFFVSHL